MPDPHVVSMMGGDGDAAQGSKSLWVRWEMVRMEKGNKKESGTGEKPIELAEQVGGGVEAEEESVNGWVGRGWADRKSRNGGE